MQPRPKFKVPPLFIWVFQLAAAFMIVVPCHAQIAFEHLKQRTGLSINSVSDIAEDSLGFIWLGTDSGLTRYDGRKLDADIAIDAQTGNRFQANVHRIIAPPSGNLIHVITFSGDLYQLDIRTGTVRPVPTPSDHGKVVDVAFQGNRTLWIISGKGVYRRDENGQFHKELGIIKKPVDLQMELSVGVPDILQRMEFDEQGNLWVTGNSGVFRKVPGVEGSSRYHSHAAADLFIKDNQVFALTQEGILRIDIASDKRDLIPLELDGFLGAENLVVDESNRIWIAANSLICYDLQSQSVTQYHSDDRDPFSISGTAERVFVDRSDRLWLTSNVGVDFVTRSRRQFGLIRESDVGLIDSRVFSMAFDRVCQLWVQTIEGKVCSVPVAGEKPIVLSTDSSENRQLPSSALTRIHMDSHNRLWIGSLHGPCVYLPDRDTVERLTDMDVLVTSFYNLPTGDLLIGGFGLTLHNAQETSRLVVRAFPNTRQPVTDIFHLEEDRYILTSPVDLVTWHQTTRRIEPMKNLPPALANEPFILAIHRDSAKTIWVATYGKGIWILENGSFSLFCKDLSDEYVYGCLEDAEGYLWFATNDGLLRVSVANHEIRRFGPREGLPVTMFNSYSYAKSTSGHLYFGSNQGILNFDPREIRGEVQDPKVFFTRLLVNNEPVSLQQPLDRFVLTHRLEHTPSIRFGPSEDFVSLEFASPNASISTAPFRYQVEGLSDRWIPTREDQFSISLTDLRPGQYTLRVQTASSDQRWSPNEARLAVIVDPALWETWWARTLAALLLFAAVVSVYRIRMAQNLAVARIKQRISDDLHDDVGLLLTHIAQTAQLGQIRHRGDAQHAFEQIGDIARNVIQQFRDILWALDRKNESWSTLIARMRLYASASLNRAAIQLEFQRKVLGSGDGWQMGQSHQLFLIFKEAIHNIVKHANATLVQVRAELTANHFRLVVYDNGVGLNPHQGGGKGFASMQKRANQIGAEIAFESQNGLRIEVTLPL